MTRKVFRHVKPYPVYPDVAEETRELPPAMDQEIPDMEAREQKPRFPLPEENNLPSKFIFHAFLDGVQRSALAMVLEDPKNHVAIPLYVARIAAAVLFRFNRQPIMGPSRSWNVVVAPFAALGEDPRAFVQVLRDAGEQAFFQIEVARNPDLLLKCSSQTSGYCGWIVADTTITGLHGGGPHFTNLVNERAVRSRAMGRIAHLRQILEMAVLIGLRAQGVNAPGWLQPLALPKDEIAEDWKGTEALLVDGPLLFTLRRRRDLQRWVSDRGYRPPEAPEHSILRNTVGLVKSHRLSPKDKINILTLPRGYRSRAYDFAREVDIHGQALREEQSSDEDDVYPEFHITCYVRMHSPPGGSGLAGLVRLDLIRPTLGSSMSKRAPLSKEEERNLSLWSASVYRERRPSIDPRQPYPFTLLEQSLHARMPSVQVLARSLAQVLGIK